MAGNLSIDPIADIALELEKMGKDNQLDNVQKKVDQLMQAVSRLQTYLEKVDGITVNWFKAVLQ